MELKNNVVKFVNDGWNLIENPNLEKVAPEREFFSQPNWNKLDTQSLSSGKCFELLAGEAIDKALLLSVNSNLEIMKKSSKNKKKDRLFQPSNGIELRKLYGVIMELEGMKRSDNSSIRDNWVKLKEEGKVPFGKERFGTLFSALGIDDTKDFTKFVDFLNTGFTSSWIPAKMSDYEGVTFDENIFKYQPSSEVKEIFKDTPFQIPVVYIPRKPNPNGLLAYSLATLSAETNKPYILMIFPFLKQPQPAPLAEFQRCRETMRKIYPNIPYRLKMSPCPF